MEGVCPNCVRLVTEGDSCPACQGPLISTEEWTAKRGQFLQPGVSDGSASAINQVSLNSPASLKPSETIPNYGLKVFLGVVGAIASMLLMIGLAYSLHGS